MVQKSNFFWAKQRNKMKEKGKGKRKKGKGKREKWLRRVMYTPTCKRGGHNMVVCVASFLL
jgi:hypothetical protein